MSFTTPSLSDFRNRFPEFTGVATDAQVAQQLADSQLWIDPDVYDSQGDYTLAVLFWVAHYLYLSNWEGVNGGSSFTAGSGSAQADLYVRSIRMGDRSVVYGERNKGSATSAQAVNSPGEELLSVTFYGQYYLQVRQRNVIPVVLI